MTDKNPNLVTMINYSIYVTSFEKMKKKQISNF